MGCDTFLILIIIIKKNIIYIYKKIIIKKNI